MPGSTGHPNVPPAASGSQHPAWLRQRKPKAALTSLVFVVTTLLMFVSSGGAQAATRITNQAAVAFDAAGTNRTVSTNPVTLTAASAPPDSCSIALTPDGTVEVPGQRVVAAPGDTPLLPYTLTRADETGPVALTLSVLSQDVSVDTAVFLDANGDGIIGEDEPAVSEVTLGDGATVDLLVQVGIPAATAAPADVYVDLTASCAGDPPAADGDNVSLVQIRTDDPPPALPALFKQADPTFGSTVTPGQAVTYALDFTVGKQPLTNVVVTDTLAEALAAPTTFSDGTLSDPQTGLETTVSASYDDAARTLSWTFGQIPAGMNVTLSVTAPVAEAAPAGTFSNQAELSAGAESALSNTVVHTVAGDSPPTVPELTKQADPVSGSTVLPGEAITYTLAFTAGDVPLTDVVLTDTLAGELTAPTQVTDGTVTDPETGLEAAVTATFDEASGTLSWSLAEVPATMSVTLSFTTTVVTDAPAGIFTNQVTLETAGATTLSNLVSHILTDDPSPPTLPTLEKTADPASGSTLTPGQEVAYALSFTAGDEPLSDVVITDTLDAALTSPTGVTDGTLTDPATGLSTTATATFDDDTRTLSWTLGLVPAGMTVTLLFETTVAEDAAAGSVTNQAALTLGDDTTFSNPVVHQLEADTPTPTLPTLTKTADPAPGTTLTPGDAITYSLAFTAGGTPLTEVVVTDTLGGALSAPSSLTEGTLTDPDTGLSTTAVAAYDEATRALTWTLAAVPPGMTVTLAFTTAVAEDAPEGTLSNQAILSTAGETTRSNTVAHTIGVGEPPTPSPLPELEKRADPVSGSTVRAGDVIAYTLDFTVGDEPLDDVVISDTLAATLGVPTAVTEGTVTDPVTGLEATAVVTYDAEAQTLNWAFDSLPAGMNVSLAFSTTVVSDAPAGTISNQATLTAAEDASLSNTVTHTLAGDTSLPAQPCQVVVTPNGTAAAPGQTETAMPGQTVVLEYQLVQAGTATSVINLDVTLLGDSPFIPDVTLIADLNDSGTVDPDEPELSATELASGGAAALLVVLDVPDDAPEDSELDVNLTAQCAEGGSSDSDNLARVTLTDDAGGGEGGEVPPTPTPPEPPQPEPLLPTLTKSADPASGQTVTAGQDIGYTLTFTAGDEALTEVVVTDVLDDALSAPTSVTSGTLTDPQTGLTTAVDASYDEDTRELTWRFEPIPATMTVTVAFTTTAADAAAAGTLSNQAELAAGAETTLSNTVVHTVAGAPPPSPCALSVTPDGTVALPGQAQTASPGEVVTFPYLLANTGASGSTFEVTPLVDTASSWSAATLAVVLDENDDGVAGVDEAEVDTLDLAAGETAALLLTLTVGDAIRLGGGELFVNLAAACADGGATDTTNMARVTVPAGGLQAEPIKTADPAAGTPLYPGAPVRYTISFTAAARTLQNVTVTDPLSEFLSDPTFVTEGLITDANGLSAAATASYTARTVTWTLAEVPAGMTVTLEFAATVRPDVPAGVTVRNRAVVTSELLDAPTNAVTHPVEAASLRLEKRAEPEQVGVGDELTYTLEVLNPSEVAPATNLQLTDGLPSALRYQAGSGTLTTAAGATSPLEPDVSGRILRWELPDLGPNERLSVSFLALVLPGAETADAITNRAVVTGSNGGTESVADDSAVTPVVANVFTARATLLGTAYVDENANGVFDRADTPVENLRLYLANGQSFVTDTRGRYSFLNLTPGLIALRVDSTTLPPFALQETFTEEHPGFWRVRLLPGTLTRQDVPFLPPNASVDVQQTLEVAAPPVTLSKTVIPLARERYQVQLTVRSEDALSDLNVTDTLPPGARLERAPAYAVTGADLPGNGLDLAVGDVPAGFTTTITYTLVHTPTAEVPLPLTTAPDVRWEEP